MITVNMYTIRDLLYTPALKGNQTTLAKLLNINRTTLRKYKDDTDNARHVIFMRNDKYVFQCSPKKQVEIDHANNAHANMA